MRRPAGSAAVLGALLALVVVTPASPAAGAEPDPRAPVLGPGLEWVAHRDNPFRQGDDPDFINSDLAFTGDHLIQGNFAGFSVWDIADPANPELRSTMPCAGGQGDVSAVGDLVVVSVDETMSSESCDAVRVPETEENWEGLRIFDVSDPAAPRHVGSVRTRCGSHTHTVVPDPADASRVFVYVSAYSRGASKHCTGRNPLQIVSIPLDEPAQAAIAGELDLFDDETAFGPGDRVPGGAETRSTTGCHDLTAYPAKALAVAACRGDGLLLSIADPLHPTVLQRVRDANVAFWHSGIFDNDATAVLFQDELGDGFINTCSPAFGADRGADAVWSLADGTLAHRSYFKIPRPQSDLEKCVAHSGGLIPVPGRFIIAQAWLEGGVSVIDLTDPAAPTELTFFDRPSYGYAMDFTAGIWSVYFYNGHLFASDMYDGLEVLRLTDPLFADAARYSATDLNPQTQPFYAWVWREAPVLPADAAARAALTPLDLAPASVRPGESPTVEVSLPAGTLEPGETVDLWWMPGASVLATATADAEGALGGVTLTVPGPLEAGSYDLVARGDRTADRLALGVLEVAAPEATPTPTPAAGAEGMPNAWLIGIAAGALLIGAIAGWVARRRANVLAKRRSTSEHSP